MIFVVVSTGHFDPLIQKCNELSGRYEFFGQVGSSTVKPLFPHFQTCAPSELQKHMREAEMVVSHAGTGMLSMIYKMGKKAVIIPKQKRYGEANDGQVELAEKWCALGMGLLCKDLSDLEKAIEACRTRDFYFPQFPTLGAHLRELLQHRRQPYFQATTFPPSQA